MPGNDQRNLAKGFQLGHGAAITYSTIIDDCNREGLLAAMNRFMIEFEEQPALHI